MISLRPVALLLPLALLAAFAQQPGLPREKTPKAEDVSVSPSLHVFGFRDFTRQAHWDSEFLAVPDAKLAQQHLKALTAAPHWASSPEDYATAQYVATQFKAAGLETEIVPYSVLLDQPGSTVIEAFDDSGRKILSAPTPEKARSPDPRIIPPFNAWSSSGDITGLVVYANYGRLADFQHLVDLGISVKDKIVLVRNGGNFRGVKVYIAQQRGARGMLIYSDPADDGSSEGPAYPDGSYRPDTDVQRGSIQYMPIYPGDPTTPGIASTPNLPASQRIPEDKLQYNLPGIPVYPLSAADAAPILRALTGPDVPRDWQGGIHFPYHLGGGILPVSVHLRIAQSRSLRIIWDVIGRIPGLDPGQAVIAGNHRDAWVYGAADPNSGTAAMLEAVHGLGVLLKQGWKPRRTIVIGSWDAEEEGLIGSTEWTEQQANDPHLVDLRHAVAYFNVDVAVAGPMFTAASVPSLRRFLREIAKEVPSPAGGTVFDQWKKSSEDQDRRNPSTKPVDEPHVGELGSGSDYTPFFQHNGVPSTDIGSDGPYGVYHTIDDNYDWFVRFADPTFAYTQQQARVFGLEIIHMADAEVLPLDYQAYAARIRGYIDQAHARANTQNLTLDFTAATAAADRFETAARNMRERQFAPSANFDALNRTLASIEPALLIPAGLPRRPWYRHSIYAPGEFTGYEAVVIPGVNEAIDAADTPRAQAQLAQLSQALNRAAAVLETTP